MDEISSKMSSLSQLLLETSDTFHVPEFQRSFVWTKEQAIDLFNDLVEDTDEFSKDIEDLQGYLLGNIVLIENSNRNYLVIDGQQRLTSLTLLFKALYQRISDIINEADGRERDKWLQRIGQISRGYQILNDEDEFKGLRITHDEGLPFGQYYRDLIKDRSDENDVKLTDSDENIKEVYECFSEKLNELDDAKISKFIGYIKNKVKLIVTIAPSEGKAFQLFEVLNDRGRSLEPMDLVKNTFLKKIRQSGYNDDDIKIINSKWKGFIENLQLTPKKKISSSVFMKHFIANEFAENKKQDELFDFFKKRDTLNSGNEILKLINKLNKYSEIYASIEKNDQDNLFLKNNTNMHLLFKVLNVKQFHPILMSFYDAEKEIKEEVVDLCVKYGASIIYSSTQTNTIEKESINILKMIKESKDFYEKKNILKSQLNSLVSNYSEKLFNNINKTNFVNSSGKANNKAKGILSFIELKFNNNLDIVKPVKRITVEHILARKTKITNYEDYGFINEDDFIRHLNRIGNLTLLYHDENTSAGINNFSDKKALYESSNFIITNTIIKPMETPIKNGVETHRVNLINEYQPQYLNTEIWNKEKIENRSSNIANLLVDITKID